MDKTPHRNRSEPTRPERLGRTLAGGLAEPGHSVVIGTRDPASTLARTDPDGMGNPPLSAWHADHPNVDVATFADAATGAEIVFVATSGAAALDALGLAGADSVGRQGDGGCLQSPRLLRWIPADPVRQGHRLAGRTDPANVPR